MSRANITTYDVADIVDDSVVSTEGSITIAAGGGKKKTAYKQLDPPINNTITPSGNMYMKWDNRIANDPDYYTA